MNALEDGTLKTGKIVYLNGTVNETRTLINYKKERGTYNR